MNIEKSIILFVIFFGISHIAHRILLQFLRRVGVKNKKSKNEIRWSRKKPVIGGLVMFISYVIYFSTYPYFKGCFFSYNQLIVTGAIVCAFSMGVIDDLYGLAPYSKLMMQLICVCLMILADCTIQIFPLDILNYTVTILWGVGIMNSINMLDNMDGVVGGCTLFILGIMFTMFYDENMEFAYLFLMLSLMATLWSFLYYNLFQNKLFMGDSGSQYLGVISAILSIRYLWNMDLDTDGTAVNITQIITNIGLVLTIFAVPISDTLIVSINRISRGISPFFGGKDHTTHHLHYLGLSDKKIVVILMAITFISGVMFAIKDFLSPIASNVIRYVWFIMVLVVMFKITQKNKDRR